MADKESRPEEGAGRIGSFPIFNGGDKVKFSFDGETIEGTIRVFDPRGGGICFGVCPSYDIEATNGTLYKHISANEVEAIDTEE